MVSRSAAALRATSSLLIARVTSTWESVGFTILLRFEASASSLPNFKHLVYGSPRVKSVDVLCERRSFACFDPLSQQLLRYVQKDKSQALPKQRTEKITLRPLVDGECDGEILMSQGNTALCHVSTQQVTETLPYLAGRGVASGRQRPAQRDSLRDCFGMLLGAGSKQVWRRDQIGVADGVASNAPRVVANETVRCEGIGDRGFTYARRT